MNRRKFLKNVSRVVVAGCSFNPLSAAAKICLPGGGVKNAGSLSLDRNGYILINGRKCFAIPTFTKEEAEKAFKTAIVEWPAMQSEHFRKLKMAHQLYELDKDEMRYNLERLEMRDEAILLNVDFMERNGVTASQTNEWLSPDGYEGYLSVHSDKGGIINGPILNEIEWDKEVPDSCPPVEDIGPPILTENEAQSAFKSATAEWPEVERECRKLYAAKGKLRGDKFLPFFAARRRLESEIQRLEIAWQRRHGIVVLLVGVGKERRAYDRLCAWTKHGRIVGPKFEGSYF